MTFLRHVIMCSNCQALSSISNPLRAASSAAGQCVCGAGLSSCRAAVASGAADGGDANPRRSAVVAVGITG